MRRERMLLLAMLLCLAVLLPVGAGAHERAYIGNLDNAGRLNLRAAPNTGAEIIGKYYEGVPVNVRSERNGWAEVDIYGRNGYVMSKYLVKGGGAGGDFMGMPAGLVRPHRFTTVGGVPVYEKDDQREVSFRLAEGDDIRVIGVVSDILLHIVRRNADGSEQVGYVLSVEVGMTENFRSCVVTASGGNQMVNLRQTPSMNGGIIGRLYPGTRLQNLFGFNTVGDGWQYVTYGGATYGYVSTKYLDFSSAGAQAYQAPVARLRGPWADWYIENDKACARGVVYETDILIAGGVFGSFVAVQQWDPFGGEHVYGFVRKNDLTAVPKASPSTQAVLTRDVPVLTGNGSGEPTPWDANGGRLLRRGATVQVLREYGTGNLPYLSGQTRWVFVQAELQDGSAAEVVVPMDALEADPLLMLPEAMTRG